MEVGPSAPQITETALELFFINTCPIQNKIYHPNKLEFI